MLFFISIISNVQQYNCSEYISFQTKVVSRSGSQQSLDEAGRSRSSSVVTSPTIPEEKPIA